MKNRVAIAQCNFEPSTSTQNQLIQNQVPLSFLNFSIGDRLNIISTNDGWAFGSCETSSREGLFPLCSVEIVDEESAAGKGKQDESASDVRALVNEIHSAIHRWWTRLKKIYSRQAEVYYMSEILEYMEELLSVRKKIVAGGIPTEELNSLRMLVASRIDRANMQMGLEVTIRRPNGKPYLPDSISLLQIYEEHILSQKKVIAEIKEKSTEQSPEVFSLLITVKSIQLLTKFNCQIVMSLFDMDAKQFFTDDFVFQWKGSEPTNKEVNFKALFSCFTKLDQTGRVALVTRVFQFAPVESASTTLKKSLETTPISHYCKQEYAFDLLDISSIFSRPEISNDGRERVIFLNRDQSFATILKSFLQTGKTPKFSGTSEDVRFLINTQLVEGSAQDIRLKKPHFFNRSPPAIIARFDQLQYVGELRNELHIILSGCELTGKERNIEARLCVVESNGCPFKEAFEVLTPHGPKLESEYRTAVFYHEEKPQWNEKIKIILPPSAAHDLFLRIALYSRKPYDKSKMEKGPIALAYAHLLRDASLLADGEHELLVYKTESSHFDDENIAYMELPHSKRLLKEIGTNGVKPHANGFVLSEKSSLVINTRACSTVLTQNQHLRSILRWRKNGNALQTALQALAMPLGDTKMEIMRFMHPLLDSLFELWEDKEALVLPVFDVIVAILRITDEQAFAEYLPILNAYIERFPYETAAFKLLQCLNHYIESAVTTNNEKTRNSLKEMGSIFRLIMQSIKCAKIFNPDPTFCVLFSAQLGAVLRSLVNLMSESRERMSVQNTALRHLPAIIDPIYRSSIFDTDKLCKFILDVIGNFGENIVARERLSFVSQLIGTNLFANLKCRQVLLPVCIEILQDHLDPDFFAQQNTFMECAIECAGIIGVLVESLFPLEPVEDEYRDESGSEEELNSIISQLYRPLVQAMIIVTQHDPSDEIRGRFFSVVIALLDKMSAAMFSAYVDERRTELDRRDFLAEMLQMCRQMLLRPPFSSTWRHMIIAQNKTIHKALRFVMSAVQNYFSKENFSPDMWKEFMQTGITFVEQLRDVDEFMKTDVEKRLCKAATSDFRSMWFRLSPVEKLNYIPELVGPFLKVALMEDNESQQATVPIFFDMMQTEATTNSKGTFDLFANELITKLDLYIEQGQGTPTFQENFTKIFKSLCLPTKELWDEGGEELLERVDRLLSHLFEYRHIKECNDSVENVMSRTIQLLRYYEEFGHQELYVVYVYKLYDLHILHSNELEAAKTLLRHTSMLNWIDEKLPDYLIRRGLNRHCATERQLKENLLLEAANLFDKGDLWEDAIRILKQLSIVYEEIIIDYVKLANLTERISSLYRKIDKEERAYYYYYLVAFYGKEFPAYLDGHKFVFRSDRLERHVDFVQRIEEAFGNAVHIKSMDDCSHLTNSEGRHIQIFNLDPIGEPCPFEDNYDVNPAIKGYYRHYNIRHFEYSRIEERRDTKWTKIDETNEALRAWIVRRKLSTFESLPCELRCSEISNISEPILISPLAHSVEQMQRKNKELREIGKVVEHSTAVSLKKLSGAVIGVVRAAVMGGIKNYAIYFTDACANICEAYEKQLVMELSALIVEQVEILEYCIYVHAKHCVDDSDKQIHSCLVDAYEEHKRYIEEEYGKTTSILPPGTSIRLSVHSNEDKERRHHTDGESTAGSSSTFKAFAMQILTVPSSKRGSTTPLTVEKVPSISRLSSDQNISVPPISPSASLTRESAISLSSIAMKIRKQANSFDGIRMRRPSNNSLGSFVPPPLPPRPTDV